MCVPHSFVTAIKLSSVKQHGDVSGLIVSCDLLVYI